MKRSLSLLLAVWSALVAGNALSAETPGAKGFLEGDLTIHSEGGANIADPKPSQTPDKAALKEYQLAVFSRDHRTEVAEVSVDEHGHYRVALPPGDYVLDVKKSVRKHVRMTEHPFTITAEKTVRVNMEIDAAFPPPM